jgi:8-oxo-dGTP diphosphatase
MPTTGAESSARPVLDQPRLATERLVLRPLTLKDIPAIVALADAGEGALAPAAMPYPFTRETALGWIEDAVDERFRGAGLTYGIERRRDQVLLGATSLMTNLDDRRGEVGFWIGKSFWNQGYATEAVRRLLDHAFGIIGLEEVVAVRLPDNAASLSVQRKLGLVDVEPGPGEESQATVRLARVTRAQHLAPRTVDQLVLVVAVALVDVDGRVLLAQRPEGKKLAGLWEFPGGKIDPGETPEAALIRELKEELDIDVSASCLAPFTFASYGYADFHLLMPLYVCRKWQGAIVPREGQRLAWVRPEKLGDYPMPPADPPLIAMLRDLL